MANQIDTFKDYMNNVFESIWNIRPFEVNISESYCNLSTNGLVNLVKGDGRDILFGSFEFSLIRFNNRLSTHKSSFKFFDKEDDSPIFSYELDRDRELKPRAYLKVRTSEQRINEIDFPLGGDILRPCVEDVILSCDNSFSIGITADDRELLKQRTNEYRSKQKNIAIEEWDTALDIP